jgi:hypothetical protein
MDGKYIVYLYMPHYQSFNIHVIVYSPGLPAHGLLIVQQTCSSISQFPVTP